jgi:hypothetical protein
VRLSPGERTSRAVKDDASVRAITGNIIQADAYRSMNDRKPLGPAERRAGHARVYVVTYNFATLERGGRLRSGARVRFDLTGGEYPFRPPTVQAADWAPWLPHVHGASGMFCIGPSWERRRGAYLIGDLILHTARILNAQEPSTRDAYDPETIAFIAVRFGGGPIDRGLLLPVVPTEVAHGTIEVPRGAFTVTRGPSGSARAGTPGLVRRTDRGSTR